MKLACEEEIRRPFDLAQGPLLRFTLFRISANRHVFMVTVHHIAFDGWSLDVFVKELATLYASFSEGQRFSAARSARICYSDFARGQRSRLQGKVLDDLVAFWRGKLDGVPPHLALPFDHPVSSGRKYRGRRLSFELGEELNASLKELQPVLGGDAPMALLATLTSFLSRYTGQTDLVIGTPTAGRMAVNTRGILGAFINTLVVRTDLSGEPTFRELLARMRRSVLDTYSHQELPFSILVSEVNPERDSSGSSLLQVMLSLHNTAALNLEIPGVRVEDHRPTYVGCGQPICRARRAGVDDQDPGSRHGDGQV